MTNSSNSKTRRWTLAEVGEGGRFAVLHVFCGKHAHGAVLVCINLIPLNALVSLRTKPLSELVVSGLSPLAARVSRTLF